MNDTIGEKIKELRKASAMTQTQLAGTEMTKSMLSHIENGNANPSMKNLQYLAMKLNKPISYFLEEDNLEKEQDKEEEKLPTDYLLHTLKNLDNLINDKEFETAKKKSINLLECYDFNVTSKLYADILFRLGTCYINLKEFEEGEKRLKLCCEVYVKNRLFIEAARAYLKLLRRALEDYQYNQCISIIEKAYELYSKSSSRDVFLEIELLTAQPYIILAQGEFEKAIEVCEKAIALSEENNIYYYSDRAYRSIAIIYLLRNEFSKFVVNMDKAKKYVEFTDDKYLLARISQNYAMYENMINNPLKAVEYLKIYEENTEERAFYYYLELSRANYLLGNYEEALQYINKIDYNEKIRYLIDCIYILTARVLQGQIYCKMKDYDKAILYIEDAIEAIKPYTSIEYKGFVNYANKELAIAYESLSEVYSLKGNYEEAYGFLKESYNLKKI